MSSCQWTFLRGVQIVSLITNFSEASHSPGPSTWGPVLKNLPGCVLQGFVLFTQLVFFFFFYCSQGQRLSFIFMSLGLSWANSWDSQQFAGWMNEKNQFTSLQCCATEQISSTDMCWKTTGLYLEGSALIIPETLNMPGYIMEWWHLEEGEEGPNTVGNPGLGWKTRLKLLISRWKGQGSRQGGWKQSGLNN